MRGFPLECCNDCAFLRHISMTVSFEGKLAVKRHSESVVSYVQLLENVSERAAPCPSTSYCLRMLEILREVYELSRFRSSVVWAASPATTPPAKCPTRDITTSCVPSLWRRRRARVQSGHYWRVPPDCLPDTPSMTQVGKSWAVLERRFAGQIPGAPAPLRYAAAP